MSSGDQKPQEFWLTFSKSDSCVNPRREADDDIHVIEKSAYDALAAELAEYKLLSITPRLYNDMRVDELTSENERLKGELAANIGQNHFLKHRHAEANKLRNLCLELIAALERSDEKLVVYRQQTTGEYKGSMEHEALRSFIKSTLEKAKREMGEI